MPVKEWPPCQVCGKPVSTEQGILTIYKKELDQYEEQHKEWEKRHPLDEHGVQILTVGDMDEMPDLISWHWGHARCLGDGMYTIDYSRFDSIGKALSWTLHLMEKYWLDFTDWEAAVRAHHKVPSA